MTPTVLLLLSVFILQGRGCSEFQKGTVDNFQGTIKDNNNTGFPKVFPKDYVVPRYFNPQCSHQSVMCCVFTKAVLLSHSWKQLLKQLERIHIQYSFIVDLITQLDTISKMSFQEAPDPFLFPSENASPGTLLTFTSSLLNEWLELNCPVKENHCVLEPPVTVENEEKEKESQGNCHEGTDTEQKGNFVTDKESTYGKEGEREKRWITVIPTNGDTGSSSSPGLFLFFCVLCLL